MDGVRLSQIASVLASETRASMVTALMGGTAHTGRELAQHVGVAASTASEHLGMLVDAGLVTVEAQGRHRFFRLANADVAALVETLLEASVTIGPLTPTVTPASHGLAFARACYDHLAGELGVRLYDRLIDLGALAVDNNANNIGARTVNNKGDNIGARTVDNKGDNIGARTVNNKGDNIGARTVNNKGDNIGARAVDHDGDNVGARVVGNIGAVPVDNKGGNVGARVVGSIGAVPVDNDGDNVGARVVDKDGDNIGALAVDNKGHNNVHNSGDNVGGLVVDNGGDNIGALAVDNIGGRYNGFGGVTLTARGVVLCERLGVDIRPSRTRPLIRTCLDWTQRRHHLAGHLGAQLLATMIERGWIRRVAAHPRQLRLTDAGRSALHANLGIEV